MNANIVISTIARRVDSIMYDVLFNRSENDCDTFEMLGASIAADGVEMTTTLEGAFYVLFHERSEASYHRFRNELMIQYSRMVLVEDACKRFVANRSHKMSGIDFAIDSAVVRRTHAVMKMIQEHAANYSEDYSAKHVHRGAAEASSIIHEDLAEATVSDKTARYIKEYIVNPSIASYRRVRAYIRATYFKGLRRCSDDDFFGFTRYAHY